jgi:hypothetical protein
MKKLIAGFLAALITAVTAVSPVLAASALKDYPTFLTSAGAVSAYVIVGSTAATSDVAGAIDLAVRLAEANKTTVSQACAGTGTVGYDGLVRDGIRIGTASGGDPLTQGGNVYSVAVPTGTLKNFHYSGLKDSTISWRSANYDYSEDIETSAVRMRHDFGTSNINGTEKMQIQTGEVIYSFVFDKAMTGLGSVADPNYSFPVNIKMMGKDFSIVGVTSGQVKVLQGSIGTADATTPVIYSTYSVYSTVGSNNAWSKVVIKDASGNTVDTLVINDPSAGGITSKDSSASGLTIKVTDVRALQDGTVVGTDLVVGPTGTVEKTYDTGADTTSTGTASDAFPGETLWGVRVASGNFSGTGTIASGDRLQVVYQPTTTQYLKAGEKLTFPNNYAELGHIGWGTDKFAQITIQQITSQSAYNSTGDVVGTSLNGLKISSDVAGTVVSKGNNGYSSAYVLLGPVVGNVLHHPYPIYVGFWDTANSRIRVADSATNTTSSTVESGEYAWRYFAGNLTYRYDFKLSYGSAGDRDYYLNVTLNATNSSIFPVIRAGYIGAENIRIDFQNKSSPVWTTTQVPEFRLGLTVSSDEVNDVLATTEATTYGVGRSTQDVVDDSGIILVAPASNSAADKVVLKVPSKELTVKAYVGKQSGTTTTGGTVSYTSYPAVPITSTIAKIDTDSDIATAKTAKHVILVGGPCKNTLVADLATAGKFAYTCAGWPGRNFGYIHAIDDGFATGKIALVVAGTTATDTRVAASALQLFDTKLTAITGSKAEVTGSIGAPVVTAV